MHVSVNMAQFSCLGRIQHRKPAAYKYQCAHTCAYACVSASVYLKECMVLMHSVCECLCMSLAAGFYAADIQLTCVHTHIHRRAVAVCNISLVQDMAGVQGRHRGHTLESGHLRTGSPPQILQTGLSPLHYSALSEVIRGGAAVLYLKPAD